MAQNTLFNILEYCTENKKPRKKHARYKKPTYVKSYQFKTFNEDTKQFQYYGDEKHIFRIKVLHNLYSMIYGYCNVQLFESFEKKEINGLIIWWEDKQAEIADTWNLPLKERVLLHINLLRNLRKNLSANQCLERMNYG